MARFNIEYTKHYYIEGQRIASKIGAGLSPSIVRSDFKVEPITGDTYEAISDHLYKLCRLSDDCVGFKGEYAYYGKELKCISKYALLDNNERELYFYHSDHIGSSSFITDADGYASQHLQYLPFGELFVEQRSTANYYTPYKFSGKEKDEETSYSYFGARYYMSDVSIWLSVDPLAEKYPNMSPYMYVAGNPVVLKDPDGKVIKPTNEAAESQLNGCLMSFVGGNGEKVYDVFHITTRGYGTNDVTLRTKSEFIKNAKKSGVKLEGENADNAYNFYVAMQSSETTEIETLYGEAESTTISAGEGGSKVITAGKDQQKYVSNNTNDIFTVIQRVVILSNFKLNARI